MSLLLFCGALLLFSFAGLWVNLVHPLFAIFCTYYLVVPYRAILEYKKRWKVQEQHDLLIQVEEMKGNFLSLKSHDLKTPVARIQGLAELVLKQGGLSEKQSGEVRQIISSTEHLNKFISKILDLTRIESSNIKLNAQSKDINKIIEKCIEKVAFNAEKKGIKLKTRLEPLFPIQVDAALLIQVFTNLIDNAIQYSPEGSVVEIFSREVNNQVEVGIQDFGRGLDPKEQTMLFTKFYRGENPAGEQVKGSGLGLYLSKYFIELHHGAIRVESEKGIGSKFTISLPLEASGK
jgi:signal transduction histidine kinase